MIVVLSIWGVGSYIVVGGYVYALVPGFWPATERSRALRGVAAALWPTLPFAFMARATYCLVRSFR
jgi:hypothetical protein